MPPLIGEFDPVAIAVLYLHRYLPLTFRLSAFPFPREPFSPFIHFLFCIFAPGFGFFFGKVVKGAVPRTSGLPVNSSNTGGKPPVAPERADLDLIDGA